MNKCPKCGYSDESFDDMMDRVLRETGERMKKEIGFGVPDKEEDKIYFDEPKYYKGELTNVKRNNKEKSKKAR